MHGSDLAWVRSYLSDRKQSVKIKDVKSGERDLPFGVPQGSVLGPILFIIYTIPLSDIAKAHNLNYHLYADDTQLYISFKPSNVSSLSTSIETIAKCVGQIRDWLTANFLQFNGEKTEVLIITKKSLGKKIIVRDICIDSAIITPSESLKNLGAVSDRFMDDLVYH